LREARRQYEVKEEERRRKTGEKGGMLFPFVSLFENVKGEWSYGSFYGEIWARLIGFRDVYAAGLY
jgi:hypothetical protein